MGIFQSIGGIWNLLFYHPLLNALFILYKYTNNIGISIIILTIIIRLILWPLLTSQLRWQRKMQTLKPHMDELKKKHGNDKRRLQEEQLKLYREHGINPAGSCSTLLIQLPVFFALYGAIKALASTSNPASFNSILYFPFEKFSGAEKINLDFLGLNLSKFAANFKITDKQIILYIIVAILVGVTQYFYSKLTIVAPEKQLAKEGKPEPAPFDQQEFANMINIQTLYFLPAFLTFLSLASVSAGVSIYWIVQNIFVIIQSIILKRLER